MKKFLLLLLVVVAVAVYLDSDRYAIRFGPLSMALNSDRNAIDTRTRRFLADIQYKDFEHAATLHAPDERAQFDIGAMIEKKFFVKPEHLDIRHFEVLRVDIHPDDASRGKAVVKATVKVLNTGKVQDVEAVFYWRKQGPEWFMALRSSL